MSAPLKILWTPEEDKHFLALVLQGYQIWKIAESVGRPRSTVGQRIKEMINQMPPREQLKYREKRPVPPDNPPTLYVDQPLQVIRGWTPEMDAKIIELRNLDWSYKRIGEAVGKADTSVNHRLIKLEEIGKFKRDPAEDRVLQKKEGRADFFRRPAGPIPANPDPPKSPRHPGYRTCLTCLASGRTKYFWSPSGEVRRCESCKRMFNICDGRGEGRSIDDRLELSPHL
jgi:transposase-like protein